MLKAIFDDMMPRPASSAAVKRSFSVQGLFLNHRRGRLSVESVKQIMVIRVNFFFAERVEWDAALQDCIERNSLVNKK